MQEIRLISEFRHFRKGEIIFLESEQGIGFYVVAGMVQVFEVSPEGKERILQIFGTGEPFGGIAVFTNRAYPANAEAIVNMDAFFLKNRFCGVHLRKSFRLLKLRWGC
ncbi:MAG: cyclic nucleotide-binding domain-containing protein [Deltaproteobacteria bacterium]|nr:cyclic nucleotide-binding domain-containing protein [Deltaproteobacteria bacterium]